MPLLVLLSSLLFYFLTQRYSELVELKMCTGSRVWSNSTKLERPVLHTVEPYETKSEDRSTISSSHQKYPIAFCLSHCIPGRGFKYPCLPNTHRVNFSAINFMKQLLVQILQHHEKGRELVGFLLGLSRSDKT